ncbi:ABC transporter substrate-binding protein [Variovorax sp. 770b2]|uniref:ABC transporter substrate-binding protein n=1 Tax=Variovorax sp. 770b2 TaxID=1566271 RepID=UPI0008EBBE05|nr:ABC transporter substrate-binding protein [Variovorax sp. 770b2]SFQ33623.1 amino acid ABC transporter substrate-binding protein, PAAT family (TC 3.A.1.3.-) [Variovorax sp. 770b2]
MKNSFRAVGAALAAVVGLAMIPVHAQSLAAPGTKTLVAGTTPKYPPFEFKDPDTGKLTGFDIDLLEALAAKLDLKVTWQDVSFDQMISSLSTKRLDVFLGGFADTEERQKSIDILDYLITGSQFYTIKARAADFPNQQAVCGKRIAAARKTIWPQAIAAWSVENCEKAGKAAIVVLGTDGSPDTRLQLKQGRADGGVQGAETLPYQNTLENGVYVPIGKPFLENSLGMGISKDNTALTAALRGAMRQIMVDGTYQKILAKWGLQDYAVKKATVNLKD